MDDFERAAAGVAGNEFDTAAAGVIDDQKSGLRNTLYDALLSNPEVAARATKLGRKTGLAPDLVERNLPEIERTTRLDQLESLPKENPVLANWLADPVNAKLSHDDLDTLGQLGKASLFRPPVAPQLREGYGFAQASRDLRAKQDRSASAVSQYVERNMPTSEIMGRERTLLESFTEPVERGLARARRGITLLMGMGGLYEGDEAALNVRLANQNRTVESFPVPENVQAGMQRISDSEGFGEAAWAILTNPGALKETVLESLGASAPSLLGAAGLSVFGPGGTATGAGIGSFAVEYGSTLQSVMDENGVDASDPMAIHAALNNPDLMDAAREKALARGLPIAAFDALTAGFAGKLLLGAKPTAGSAATRTAGELGLQAGGGAAGEATAQYATDEFKPGDILLEAIAELPTGIVEIPANYRQAIGKATRAEQQTRALEELNNLAKASKVAQRDPESFQSFIAQATEDGPVQSVFVDARFLMQSGMAPSLAELSPSVRQQLERAILTGGDIAIPVDEYAARIATTDLAPQLLDHLKTEPDGFSRAEAQQFMAEQGDILQAEVERILSEKQGDDTFNASRDAVKTQILADMNSMGRFTEAKNESDAMAYASYYAARAAQLGVTPEELYQRRRVNFAGQGVAGQALNQGATETPEFRNWFGDSKVVDTDGKPLVVYHGTAKDFSRFDIKAERNMAAFRDAQGFYFTSDPRDASAYTEDRETGDPADGANLMPTYLRIDNPLRVAADDIDNHPAYISEKRRAALEAEGYDGIIYADGVEFVVFRPEQIKSAIGNRGTFDPNDPNILHQSGLSSTEQAVQRWKASLGKVSRDRLDYMPTMDTPTVLREFGIGNGKIGLPTRYLLAIRQKHPDVPLGVFENLPALLSDPVFVYPHKDGGANVVIDTTTESGEVIVVGVRDGRIRTVTPRHGEGSVPFALTQALGQKGVKIYARNKEALTSARASAVAAPATIAMHRKSNSAARIVTRDDLVKRHGDAFYQPADSTGNRGEFSPDALTVALLKGADLSTALHEGAHFFFENDIFLASELVQQANAFGWDTLKPGEKQILADVSALMSWHGIQGSIEEQLRTWHNMDFEEKRSHHERTAESFEKYLFEGKAPSIELAPYFQKFRAWMLSVYSSITDFLKSNPEAGKLNDEVRSVFDRMLATNEQIQLAEQGRSMMPLFASAEQAANLGVIIEDFAAYQATDIDATNDAIQDLQAKGLRDMQWLHNARGRAIKKLQKESKALRAEAMIEARREVMSQPVYRAWEFLTNRDTEASGKLDGQALRDMGFSADDTKRLRDFNMVRTEGGFHPEIVAEQFELSSGDELVRALVDAIPPKDAINTQADAIMLERHGELSTPEAIERAADAAIHNDVRTRMLATEANALSKAAGERKVLASAAKEYARAMIDRLKVRNVKPGQYANAEVRAAKASKKASESGDLATAAAEKRNQLVNAYATRAAYDAQDEVKAGLRYLKRFDKRSKTLDPEYQDQIEAMLERFDLKPVSNKALDKRASLAQWIESQRAAGIEPDLPPELENEAFRTSYKDMTVEEFRGLIDTVKQIEHLGRLKHKLLTAQDKREFAAIVDEVSQSIVENGGKARPVALEQPGRLKEFIENFRAGHRKLASLVRQMDGGKDAGPFWRVFVRGMNEAGTKEASMVEDATERLMEIYKPMLALKGGLNGDKRFIQAINGSLTRAGRLSVALNWGNETNRLRVMEGDGWTEYQVQAILDTMTREEWAFVQNVWNFIDSYWPQIEAKEKRVTGRAPDKVKALPFTVTVDGESVSLSGGYYPIKYDSNRSDRAEKHEAAEIAEEMKRGAYTRASTKRGHTKARTESVKRPIRKTLDVITQHVGEVTHDLAWHEWLIDANRLIDAKPINDAIRTHYGTAVVRTMKDALTGIAAGDQGRQTALDTALLYLRANVSRSTMGFSLTTAFLQPFGLLQSVVRIGAKPVLHGIGRWAGDIARMESTLKWVGEKSEFMRLRAKTFNRELNEIRNRVSHGHSKIRTVYDASLFMLMQKMQMVADIPTWIGAYDKALADGVEDADAVALADQAVLDSQGGGQNKDMAEIQRKHPLLAMFYGYFNTTLNLAAESTAQTDFKNPLAVAGWMSDMMLLMVIPALGPAMILALMRGDACWEEGDCARELAQAQLGYTLGTVVGVREMSGMAQGYDYAGPPVGRVIADLGKFGTQVSQGETDEAAALSAVRLFGTALGIPTVQIVRSWRGWQAWEEGDAPATSILMGPPPND